MPRLIESFSTELLKYLGPPMTPAVPPTPDDFRFSLIDFIDFKGTTPSTAPDLGYSQLHTHGQQIIDVSSEEIKRYLEYATCIPDETKARRQQEKLAAARVQADSEKEDTLAATQATAAAIAAEPKADMPTLQHLITKSVDSRLTSTQKKKKRPRGTGNKGPAATADAKEPPRKKAKNSLPVPKHPKATGNSNNKGTKKAAAKQSKAAASKAKQGKKQKKPNVPTPTDSGIPSSLKKHTRFTTSPVTPTNQKKPPPNTTPGRQPGRGRGRGHPGSGTSRGRGRQKR